MHGGRMLNAHRARVAPTKTAPRSESAITPMMAQYLEIKAAHPGYLLFYRMGDFFEMFFDDAKVASAALGIHLTKRGKHQGEDIAMCGVPVVRAEEYLQKLIAKGFRVAVCEQTENPAQAKKRGAGAVVRREVVRLVTPGTLTEESLLDPSANNFLTALFRAPASTDDMQQFALASLDISTGEFLLAEVSKADLPGELARLAPKEAVIAETLAGDTQLAALAGRLGITLTPVPRAYFDSRAGDEAIRTALETAMLDGFGDFTRAELAAAGALLKYVELTQIGERPLLRPPRKAGPEGALVIDAATQANLELTRSVSGTREGSLLWAIDRTVSGPGARELAARLARPLTDVTAINARLDAVGYLAEEPRLRTDLREALKGVPDVARALSRLKLNRGAPRDLGAVRDILIAAETLGVLLGKNANGMELPGELAGIAARLAKTDAQMRHELEAALADELPPHRRDGGFIRTGYAQKLDENRRLRDDSRSIIAALQGKYAEATGIKSLKVRHNNVLGYFVEVSAGNAGTLRQAPHEETFRHRQTLANSVRFTTVELGELESRITLAAERALAIEQQIFAELCQKVLAKERLLAEIAAAGAELDAICGLAEVAAAQGYVRPKIDESTAFKVEGGRHPVVEQMLARSGGGPFIENDCALDASPKGNGNDGVPRIILLTGPNMAGKSTYLRQNALFAILAQMGSFVPARSARIGIVDRLFSRIGASDDLARGRSTFMVEMVETAAILNQAGPRALVILDEIGRGTATYDGLSIAWAAIEYLHEINKCRVLFATHYHELTALAGRLEHTANATIRVKEWRDGIVFLYQVVPGAADRSYGIQVAKLAGLPRAVVRRAREVLEQLERKNREDPVQALADDLPLFSAAQLAEPAQAQISPLEEVVAALDPDHMTPREALETVYHLKELMRRRG